MFKHPHALLIGTAGFVAAGYWITLSSYSQILGRFPYRRKTTDRIIALTFDDGPNEPFTTQIGDFLASKSIRATFFQVGRCVERFPEATASLIQQGHVIGNHSYTHQVMKCLRPGHQQRQTQATQEILTRMIGRTPALYRPPWLLRTPALHATLGHLGLQPVSGEFCHAFEVFQPAPERIARRALAKVKPGAILIFHDGFDARPGDRANTVEAVKIVAASLLHEGYRFVTVDDLLDIPAYQSSGIPGHEPTSHVGAQSMPRTRLGRRGSDVVAAAKSGAGQNE